MDKQDFMRELKRELSDFNEEQRNQILYDYEKQFKMGEENGKNNIQLLREFGNPRDIAAQYRSSAYKNAEAWNIENNMGNKHRTKKRRKFIALPIIFLAFIFLGTFIGLGFRHVKGHRYVINETKTSSLNGIDEISVDVSDANLNFYSGKGNKLKTAVDGTMSAIGNYSKPRLKYYKSGNTLHVEFGESHQVIMFSDSSNMKMDVYIPEAYKNSIKVKSSEGDVSISNFKIDKLNCQLDDGDLNVSNINVSEFSNENSEGDITAKNITTDSASINSSDGDVKLDEFNAASITYNNSEGNLEANNISVKSSSFESSDGDIDISGFSGDIKAVNSEGDTKVQYNDFNNDVQIESSDGDIQLELPRDAKFNLAANTDDGDLKCDFPVTVSGSRSESTLKGNVGSSSNKVKLNNSEGNISISK
ncbi:DUF4097 family beta strand repeat-containing protein [Clostridium oryzae]|uniref:DUF4097 domain-containing protein n=1 Tax=Clostridium oryzae TaxID=1450648 RepID=A0A1V4I3L7_9CLOT|nr:DUF4097 family beta strand repeat-containing protein [Clostridium oryzae]OPJ54573.1 hypothetical protein CLORY_45570 [Clostridium oryzae]